MAALKAAARNRGVPLTVLDIETTRIALIQIARTTRAFSVTIASKWGSRFLI
jgi:hypothetical protein